MRLTFGRPADVDRHVLSVHMKVYVHCKRHRGGGCVPRFARFDGFQRHLRDTCIKEGERADLEKEVMKQLQVTNPEDPRIDREICRRFAFIPRPCYQSDLFKKGLSVLRVPKTALLLEREWRANVEDIRQCKCCEDLTDEEKDAIPLSIAPECLRSQPGSAYRDGPEALGGDDDRLLPEEEEGVNEEPIPDLSGHASNLDVGPVYSTIRLPEMHSMGQEFPALDLYDLGEQESHKCSSRGHGEALADHWDETFQTTDSGNVIDDPAGNPHELETQPWYIDFGAEAIDPNATWLGSS